MERIKKYKTLSDFLSERDKCRVYEGYVIGYGYAFYESVAIKPPHLIHNDSICSRYVPYEMSFFQTMWQQNLDRSPEAIMESFGDNNEYLIRGLVREQNGMQYINMGYGEILEVPVERTTISIGISSVNEFTLSVKSVSEAGSIERTTTMNLDDFHVIFDNPNWTTRLTNAVEQLGLDAYKNSDTFQFGWGDAFGAVDATVGFRGNIPHNELFWRQQNGRWKARIPTRGNYLYNRSYNLKGQRLAGWRAGGNVLGAVSAGFIAYDVVNTKKIDWSDAVNTLAIGVSMFWGVGTIIAGLWFIADVSTGLITGESISDRLETKDIANWGE